MTGNSGLEGVVIGESRISSIIGTQLTYCGYEIDDLAENAEFEEVVFLLWHDHLPDKEELKAFKQELYDHAFLTDEAKGFYKTFVDKSVHPMSALRTAVSCSHTQMKRLKISLKKRHCVKQSAFRRKSLQSLQQSHVLVKVKK